VGHTAGLDVAEKGNSLTLLGNMEVSKYELENRWQKVEMFKFGVPKQLTEGGNVQIWGTKTGDRRWKCSNLGYQNMWQKMEIKI
jgi:hypothetical protein